MIDSVGRAPCPPTSQMLPLYATVTEEQLVGLVANDQLDPSELVIILFAGPAESLPVAIHNPLPHAIPDAY